MSEQDVETCEKDQAQFDKLSDDQQYAVQQLKVTSTPTFFLNGVRLQGAMRSRNWKSGSSRCSGIRQ